MQHLGWSYICELSLHTKFQLPSLSRSCCKVCGWLVWCGLAVSTMSNFNPSCIELELGLGFDNCWLPSTSSRSLPNNESIYIVRLVTSDIPGRRVYSFLKKLNIKLTVFFKIYMVYQSSLQNISPSVRPSWCQICHLYYTKFLSGQK